MARPASGSDLLDLYGDGSAAGSDIDRWGNDWGGAGDHADIDYLVIGE